MKLVIAFDTFMTVSFLFWIKKFDNKNRNLLKVYHIIYILQSLYCAALVTVLALSKYVKVKLGLMLFIPCVTEKEIDTQLHAIEEILPSVNDIEPEILSVNQGTEFANHPENYGIKLWATERTINDSWCYGLSPDIPWTFCNKREAKIWFKHYDKLRSLLEGFVQPHYWDSIDHVRLRF